MKLLFAVMNQKRYALCRDDNKLTLPEPDVEVETSYGFASPDPDNLWIYEKFGVRVYRKYLFFSGHYCVAVFEPSELCKLNDGYEWVDAEQLSTTDIEKGKIEALLLAQNANISKTAPWMSEEGYAPYLSWAEKVISDEGYAINGVIQQIKNAFVSSIFCIPTSDGNRYLKISSSVYVNDAKTECAVSKAMGEVPEYLAVSEDGMACLMREMGGSDGTNGEPEQYKRWLELWGEKQIKTVGENSYKLVDSTPQFLLNDIPRFKQRVKNVYETMGKELCEQDIEILGKKLSEVQEKLEQLCSSGFPNALCHADIRPGNMRIIDGCEHLYDWGMAFYGHPFYDAIHFLHVVRRQLDKEQKKNIIAAYLSKWEGVSDIQSLHTVYEQVEHCKDYFMLYADCRWVVDILEVCNGIPAKGTMDDWLLSARFDSFDRVLHRFLFTDDRNIQRTKQADVPYWGRTIKSIFSDETIASIRTTQSVLHSGVANMVSIGARMSELFQPISKNIAGISSLLKSYIETMTPWCETFENITKTLSSTIASLKIPTLTEEEKERRINNHRAWGSFGWTWFPEMPWFFFDEAPADIKEANAQMAPYCTKESMEMLFIQLRQHKIKKEDLESAIFCYENRQYKACALLLFGIIDSKLIRFQPYDSWRKVGEGAVRKAKEKFEENQDEQIFYIVLRYANLFECLATFFGSGSNFKKEPLTINRNYVDHGMNRRAVRKRDCIQLFLALDNLMEFLSDF